MPGRDVDATAIEQEKIQQKGLTQRKLIEEKEKTKRDRALMNKEKWTDGGFQMTVTLGIAAVCLACSIVGGIHVYYKTPHAPAPIQCIEVGEVISSHSSAHSCGDAAHMETQNLPDGNVLVLCKCPDRSPIKEVQGDAGKP